MRYFLILLLIYLFLIKAPIHGQSTYNFRLDFDRPVPTVLTSIEVTDSCFYVCGITNDSLSPFSLGSLFSKISFEGEVLWYKTFLDPNKYIGTWRNTLTPTIDGNFTVTAAYFDTISQGTLLIKYNPMGDTIFTNKYISPYAPSENFNALISSTKASDEGYFILMNIHSFSSHTDIYLVKTDNLGNEEWSQVYGGIEMSESGGSIYLEEDKIIIGGHLHNINYVDVNHISRTYIFAINNQGELQWEYLSPEGELMNSASDILPTEDGGYLIASGKGFEIPSANPNYAHLTWHSYIFKLDSNRNFEWGVDIKDSLPTTSNQLTKLLAPSDNSGYIAIGKIYEPNYEENGLDRHGIISKISLQGDSLWTRYYNHVVSPADNHVFYDVEETADGGFIMVGQATENYNFGELPLQRAWIVKVDEHGCLVPDCHLISDVLIPEEQNFHLSLYPNPTSDYLNIYFRSKNSVTNGSFRVVDMEGRIIESFSANLFDATYMLSVYAYTPGVYFLQYLESGMVLQTEKFVVQK